MLSMVAVMALLRDRRWAFPLHSTSTPDLVGDARYVYACVSRPGGREPETLQLSGFSSWDNAADAASTDLRERDWFPLCIIDRYRDTSLVCEAAAEVRWNWRK